MGYTWRIVLTLAGLILGKGIKGAVLGFIAGFYFDWRAAHKQTSGKRVSENIRNQFLPFLFASLGYVAKSDGRISEAEVEHAEKIMQMYGFDILTRKQAIEWFKSGSRPDNDYEQRLKAFAAIARFRPDVKKVMLEMLIGMALADGVIHPGEEKALFDIAVALGVNQRLFRALLDQLKGQQAFRESSGKSQKDTLAEAYAVLGVKPGDDMAVIKKAYRKRMSEHHPDKLMAQGVPEEVIKIATEKSQVIQAAYELICKNKG